MKSSKRVVAVLALLSLGALAVQCNRANLQEVLEEQHLANAPTYTLVESETIISPVEPEPVTSTGSEQAAPSTKTTSQDDEVELAADRQQGTEARKGKRVKVITIAAPDYSIRIEAKPDTPLAIGSTEDPETEESAHYVPEAELPVVAESEQEDKDAAASILEGIAPEEEEEPVETELTKDESEVKVSSEKIVKKAKKTDGGQVAEQALDEEKQRQQQQVKEKEKQVNKKSRKSVESERTKRQVKQQADKSSHKRDKRETKKSGTSKNGKAKRSAEKSKKYKSKSHNKGKGSKSSKKLEL